MPIIAEKSY